MVKVITSVFKFITGIFVTAKEEYVTAFTNIKSGNSKVEDYGTPIYILAGMITSVIILSIPFLFLTGYIVIR